MLLSISSWAPESLCEFLLNVLNDCLPFEPSASEQKLKQSENSKFKTVRSFMIFAKELLFQDVVNKIIFPHELLTKLLLPPYNPIAFTPHIFHHTTSPTTLSTFRVLGG